MLPASGLWSFNEAILTAGQATSDNLVPQLAQINYMVRTDTIVQADAISAVMDNNAEAAAKAAFCNWRKTWVAKSRADLPITCWRAPATVTWNWWAPPFGAVRQSK